MSATTFLRRRNYAGDTCKNEEFPAATFGKAFCIFWYLGVAKNSYHSDLRMDQHFHVRMNTYDYEDWLFRIDSNLKDFRDLKEQYVLFNSRNGGNPIAARTEIDELIDIYKKSSYEMFRDFASLLEKYKDPIINSFIMVEKIGNGKIYDSRLSNGPIESINRKVKDLKRLGRGFRNVEHFRNRFLYATRSAPVLNGMSDHNPVTYFEEDEF